METAELKTQEADDRQPWHKPSVQQITVSLDTGLLPGSAGDAEGGDLFFSDLRLKQDVAGVGHALEALATFNTIEDRDSARSGGRVARTGQYVPLIPVLVEAIKEQQRSLSVLEDEIRIIRRTHTP